MSIDYGLLERQRVHLLSVVNERRQGMTTRHALLGLLQLVDYLIEEDAPNMNVAFVEGTDFTGADIVNSVPRMPPPSGVISPDYPYDTNVFPKDT